MAEGGRVQAVGAQEIVGPRRGPGLRAACISATSPKRSAGTMTAATPSTHKRNGGEPRARGEGLPISRRRARRARRPAAGSGVGAAGVVRVEQAFLGFESATPPVRDERNDDRQQNDAGAGRAGEAEVEALGAQQQHGAVHRVHGVVPDQGRQDAPSQHDDAEGDAADADLDAANIERLLRIAGVAEAPDEAGEDQREHGGSDQFAQERDARTCGT